MLLATKECMSCRACDATNIAHRATCWRCGAMLPGRNAALRSARFDPAPAPWSDVELNSLLSQAILIDLTKPRRSAAKRAHATQSYAPARIHASQSKRTSTPRALSGATLRAATTLSFTLFSIITAPGPCESSGKLSASPAHQPLSATFSTTAAHRVAAKASPSLRARRQMANAHPILSLSEEAQKIQADLDARTREFLTTGLNMVRDYEAAHGSVLPKPDASHSESGASYSDYIAHMKFMLMKEGVI